jgi:hypothetical protein
MDVTGSQGRPVATWPWIIGTVQLRALPPQWHLATQASSHFCANFSLHSFQAFFTRQGAEHEADTALERRLYLSGLAGSRAQSRIVLVASATRKDFGRECLRVDLPSP